MSTKTASGLIAYCKAQLGRPYWMGTFGQTASAGIYQSNKKRLPQYYSAADFPQQYGQRVHDCIGLIKGYLWSDGPDSAPKYLSGPLGQDLDANGMYYACSQRGGLTTMPDTPGTLVFIRSAKTGKMEHIGVYIGGGYCIEARGHAYGVVQTKLRGRGWTHWGLCPYITYDSATGAESEDEDMKMTGQEIFDTLNDFLKAQPCPDWAKPELQEAIALGITDGTRPCELIPRYQAAIMAKRAVKGGK
jgi:hypothetical protein